MPILAADLADAAWRRGLAPTPILTVSEWAERNRVLPATSSEPGPWRNSRTPYLRAVMDALSESSAIEVVVMVAGSQVGKTECGLNWLGYLIDHVPGLALIVQPSLDTIKRNVRTRIDPMIEASPILSKLVGPARSKDGSNSMFLKEFPGGQLVMTGANSAASLRSTPARYLFLDEVDAFPGDVDGEGDPVDLAIRRTATFRSRRKVLMVSTPTIAGHSRIWSAYEATDQRRLFVPCQECGAFAPITWARIRWPKGKRADAYLACEECGGFTEEHQKIKLLTSGEWRATARSDGISAGFHLPTLYSPFESWGRIAIEHGLVKSDPPRLQVWTNTALAECWEDVAGETLNSEILFARREPIGTEVPAWGQHLTAGVDVQDDRLEVQVLAWGHGEESSVVAYEVLPGDPSGGAVWADLDAFLLKTWRRGPDHPAMTVSAACVDTGGHNTRGAYDFCRHRHSRRVWAIKGSSDPLATAWPRKPTYQNTGKVPLYLIGTDALKDVIAARLGIVEPGPGMIHFPAFLPPHYFEQLTAERRVTRYRRGRPIRKWEPRGSNPRNEAFDTFVYAFAALCGLQALGVRLEPPAPIAGANDDAPTREYANVAGKRMKIPISAIRARMSVRVSNDTLHVKVKSNNIPLIALGRVRQNKAGVYSEMRGLYEGAFIATMKSGYRGVFMRNPSGEGRVPRGGLHEVHGPSPAGEIERNRDFYFNFLREQADAEFLKHISQGVVGILKAVK